MKAAGILYRSYNGRSAPLSGRSRGANLLYHSYIIFTIFLWRSSKHIVTYITRSCGLDVFKSFSCLHSNTVPVVPGRVNRQKVKKADTGARVG